MKKLIFLLAAAFVALSASAQTERTVPRFSFSTSLGTGIAMSEPSSTPFLWRITGYYNVSRRFAVGAGTGVSCYEKTLIPLFADARFLLTRPRKFTPFLQCGVGYAFAPQSDANGGFLLDPAIGVQYALHGRSRIFFSAGYEMQKLERLKTYSDSHFAAEFAEKLNHHAISLTLGFLF